MEFRYVPYREQWRTHHHASSSNIDSRSRKRRQAPWLDGRCTSFPSNNRHQRITIFDLCWYHHHHNHPQPEEEDPSSLSSLLLLGCTNHGHVCVWKVPPYLLMRPPGPRSDSDDDDDDSLFVDRRASSSDRKPIRQWKVSKGVLYSIRILNKNNKELLVVSGDDGVLVLDWTAEIQRWQEPPPQPALQDPQAKPPSLLCRLKPYPSPWESQIEVNQVCAPADDRQDEVLYGAVGDAFGCYKWNLETQQVVKTYTPSVSTSLGVRRTNSGGGYLHTMQLVPSLNESSSSPSSQWLLTGGEDGVLGIWDVHHDRLVDQLDLNSLEATTSTTATGNSTGGGNGAAQTKKKGRTAVGAGGRSGGRWISSIVQVQDSWWTIGGGHHSSSSPPPPNHHLHNVVGGGVHAGGGGGFLATFHAPTRSWIQCTATPHAIHQLATTSPSSSGRSHASNRSSNSNTVLSVSNGTVSFWSSLSATSRNCAHDDSNAATLSFWNPWNLDEPERQVWCSPSASAYAVATTRRPEGFDDDGDGDWLAAVGGIGTSVDLLDRQTQQVIFRFQVLVHT